MVVSAKIIALRKAAEQAEEALATEETLEQNEPVITRKYTVTASHPPQLLPLGLERQGRLTAINCTGRVTCVLLDGEGNRMVSIDADGVDMVCDLPFVGPVGVLLETASSITFTIVS